jgi:hypothetical protein
LDIRASDILQANGVVWVEGPSDRIYLRRWLDLASGGELVEGVHYTIMFYGGRLLSHLSALPPGEQDGFVSTLSINRNVALIMDSDRHRGKSATASAGARRPRMRLNDTKERIRAEIDAARGLAWVTEGREIENYLSPRVLEVLTGKAGVEMDLYADIPEHHLLGAFKKDKISLANAAVDQTNIDDLDHLDLRLRLAELVTAIRMWNTM